MKQPAADTARRNESSISWLDQAEIEAGQPLSEQVYRLVRQAIVTGSLMPGAALQENAITGQLGVSRTPVREALLRLREDGLVVIRRQSGTYVAPIDASRVEEGIIVRESLEPRVAEIAASRIDTASLDELARLTDIMGRAAERQDSKAFIAADDLFHQRLIDASGHLHIARIIQKVNAQLDRIRYLSVSEPIRAQTAVQEHHQLLAALAGGDRARAGSLLREHLKGSWVLIRQTLGAMTPAAHDPDAGQNNDQR